MLHPEQYGCSYCRRELHKCMTASMSNAVFSANGRLHYNHLVAAVTYLSVTYFNNHLGIGIYLVVKICVPQMGVSKFMFLNKN